jgi:dihydrofolate reductase
VDEAMGEVFADHPDLLLGRKTYEIFAAYWPNSQEPGAGDLNNAKKYVASRTLDKVDWNNSTLLGSDVAGEIKSLKASDGPELQVHGSSNLIQTLLTHELIDECTCLFSVAMETASDSSARGQKPRISSSSAARPPVKESLLPGTRGAES